MNDTCGMTMHGARNQACIMEWWSNTQLLIIYNQFSVENAHNQSMQCGVHVELGNWGCKIWIIQVNVVLYILITGMGIGMCVPVVTLITLHGVNYINEWCCDLDLRLDIALDISDVYHIRTTDCRHADRLILKCLHNMYIWNFTQFI
jgi:hypothetical protein